MQVAYICMFLNYGYVCLSHMSFLCYMDPDGVNMMLGVSMADHITLLHAKIDAHTQDPFSKFHNITVCAHRLLWSFPTVDPWVEFRLCYHHYMVTGYISWDGPRFKAQGVWTSIVAELLRKEFEQKGITVETLWHVFPLNQAHPLSVALAPAKGPPFPPAPSTPLMPDSLGEAYVVIDLPDTTEIVMVSSEDEGH